MIGHIVHAIRLLRQRYQEKHQAQRSSKWPAVEHMHLTLEPTCAACGGRDRLNVHHVKPFHIYPELELDPRNLITLCMGIGQHCHLLIGHGGNFKMWNPNVDVYALAVRSDQWTMAKATEMSRRVRRG